MPTPGVAITVRQIPRGQLGHIWDERTRDWAEEAAHYVQLYRNYREQYYRKICSKCTHAQKVRRKCTLLIPGFTEQHCRHIDLAFASKYRAVIRRRHESHPFMQRILLNIELERRRKGGERSGQGGKAGGLAGTTPAGNGAPHPPGGCARRSA